MDYADDADRKSDIKPQPHSRALRVKC